MTKLEPTLTSLRSIADTHHMFGNSKTGQVLQDAADAIEGLESENARLQAARDVVVEDAKEIAAQLCDARAENAKLRELCETFGMIANDAVCDYYERDEMLEQANATARELGVEL